MSYTAHAYGEIAITSPKEADRIIEKIPEVSGLDLEIEDDRFGKFVIFRFRENYHESEIIEALDMLTPVAKEGSVVKFTGESDDMWRFILRRGTWEEQNGHVIYSESATPEGSFFITREGCNIFLTEEELQDAARYAAKGGAF